MHKKTIDTILLLLVLALNTTSLAQRLQIRTYGTKDGIPQSEVDVLYQDRAGHIWVGTFENGLARYDGESMQTFTFEDSLPNLLSVRSVYEDREENVWVGTEGGLACIKLDGSVQAFTTNDGLPSNVINHIIEGAADALWLATGAGLCQVTNLSVLSSSSKLRPTFQTYHDAGDNFSNAIAVVNDSVWVGTNNGLRLFYRDQFLPLPEAQRLAGRVVRELKLTRAGELWVGTAAGLFILRDGKARGFTQEDGLFETDIFCFAEDQENRLWIGTRTGLFKYDGKTFAHYDTRHGLPNAYIRSMLVDYENNLWLGTWGGGVGKIYGWTINNYDQRNGLPENAVFSFMQDRERRVWIGTNGGGIALVSGEEMQVLNTENGLPNNVVRGMTQAPNGDIWIATHGGAARLRNGAWQHFTTRNGFPDDLLRDVYAAPNGDIWFASAFHGALRVRTDEITAMNRGTGFYSNSTHQVYQDHNGRLWIATTNGLYRREANGEEKFYTSKDGLPDSTIYTIFEEQSGDLWFGTRAGGAVCLVNERFQVINTKTGLRNNVVYFIAQDERQRLWFGTNAGMACFNKKDSSFFYLNASDGLLDDECNTRAAMFDTDGYLWAGTIGGASRIATALWPRSSLRPRVKITALEVNDKKYYDLRGERIRVPYESTVTVHFATLSFLNEDKTENSVRLEGFKEEWESLGQQRSVRYTNLSPKRYTFYLRGRNSFASDSIGTAQVEFQILAPFYLTAWFFLLSAFALAATVFGLHRWRVRQVKARAAELEEAVTQKTEELRHTLSFLATVKDFLPLGLLVVDAEETIVDANRVALNLFETELHLLRGQKLFSLLSSPLSSRAMLWRALTQKKAGLELVAQPASGKHFVCEIHSDRVLDAEGRLRFLILTCENIEAQKQLEQKVLDHEKQAALVNLAVGMGEVLQQKLAGVNEHISALHEQFAAHARESAVPALQRAQSSVQEMEKVLRQLLEFTAYLTKAPSLSVDLRQELKMLAERWRNKITVTLPHMPHAIPARILSKLRDGWDEALQNSLDAGAQHVAVEVELLLDHARVRVSFSDDGEGLAPETRNKVFLPFFKTRGTPHAGLGLWKLYQVVQQCGGSVEIAGLPERGTQLRLTLPVDLAKYHAHIATEAEEERHAKSRAA